ncbi:MAG TPA: D-alanine--D-alanine ligase [Sphaerochaeta sp.]|nr:D-alanine--D-alanine ligase [Sphaerochaeta sp.]
MQIALIYGGRSTEHAVSVRSARSVCTILQERGHTIYPIAIAEDGRWFLQQPPINADFDTVAAVQVKPGIGLFVKEQVLPIEVIFAPTHGQGGEDGDLQGLCRLAHLPLVGCDTLASSVGMYKMVSQILAQERGVPTIPTLLVHANTPLTQVLFTTSVDRFGGDLFIKAESSGSSVGVYGLKRANYSAFVEAITQARRYSERVLIQPFFTQRIEAECAILERADGEILVAGPGRVIDPGAQAVGFLDYQHKYQSQGGAYIDLDWQIESSLAERIRHYAKETFIAIKGSGYARVDFFLTADGPLLNEINTAPGLTDQSHWPALIQSLGYELGEAYEVLLATAIATHQKMMALSTVAPELL